MNNEPRTSNQLWKKLTIESVAVSSPSWSPIKPSKKPINHFFHQLHNRMSDYPMSMSSDSEIVSIRDITYSEQSNRQNIKPE